MTQTNAFGQPLEPAPGFVPQEPNAAELARREAEYGPAEERALPDDIIGTAPPEHTWPGTALVATLYGSGLFSLGRILFLLRDTGDMTPGQVIATLPMMLFPAAVLLWTARLIQRFSLAGLGLATLGLLSAFAGGLGTLLNAGSLLDGGLGVLGAGLAALWIGYLWSRRADFS